MSMEKSDFFDYYPHKEHFGYYEAIGYRVICREFDALPEDNGGKYAALIIPSLIYDRKLELLNRLLRADREAEASESLQTDRKVPEFTPITKLPESILEAQPGYSIGATAWEALTIAAEKANLMNDFDNYLLSSASDGLPVTDQERLLAELEEIFEM